MSKTNNHEDRPIEQPRKWQDYEIDGFSIRVKKIKISKESVPKGSVDQTPPPLHPSRLPRIKAFKVLGMTVEAEEEQVLWDREKVENAEARQVVADRMREAVSSAERLFESEWSEWNALDDDDPRKLFKCEVCCRQQAGGLIDDFPDSPELSFDICAECYSNIYS